MGPGADSFRMHAMQFLLIQLLLQILLHPGEFHKAAIDLTNCCKKAFSFLSQGNSSEEEEEGSASEGEDKEEEGAALKGEEEEVDGASSEGEEEEEEGAALEGEEEGAASEGEEEEGGAASEVEEEEEEGAAPQFMDVLVGTFLYLLPHSSGPLNYAIEQASR